MHRFRVHPCRFFSYGCCIAAPGAFCFHRAACGVQETCGWNSAVGRKGWRGGCAAAWWALRGLGVVAFTFALDFVWAGHVLRPSRGKFTRFRCQRKGVMQHSDGEQFRPSQRQRRYCSLRAEDAPFIFSFGIRALGILITVGEVPDVYCCIVLPSDMR